jgi:A/G-specific adenine glycosylase
MLQQTQVETVKPYFERFLKRFPSIHALAAAEEEEVLRLWEGLGYYRRARQLHQAARLIVARHGGEFPRDPEAVRRLPGIGRYTAGAILSIAFDAREPILEANTVRLLARLLAYRGDPASAAGTRLLWAVAEAVLPRRVTGAFNQGLMELGSTVCLARGPRCHACPVALLCRARERSLVEAIPAPKAKPRVEARREAAVVVRRGGRVLLVKCPDGGRWAGLWDFPRFVIGAEQDADLRAELAAGVARLTGIAIEPGEHLASIRHGVTRFRITLLCYQGRWLSGPNRQGPSSTMRWVQPSQLDAYPLSTTGRKLSRLVGSGAEA